MTGLTTIYLPVFEIAALRCAGQRAGQFVPNANPLC